MRVFRHKFDRIAVRIGGADISSMFDEDARRGLPGVSSGEFDACLARNMQRFEARLVEIVAQDANRRGPDDVAGAAIFLASRAGAYVNGAILTLDGGMGLMPG